MLDPLRVPFVVSSRLLEKALRDGPEGVEGLLRPHVAFIERSWKRGARVEAVLLACGSLRSALTLEIPTTEAGMRLRIVEADASLAAARSTADADRAFDLAELAQRELLMLKLPEDQHLYFLSEAMLVAGVALKAIGLFDECIEYMRLQASDRRLNDVEAISLRRQEVMMFQSEQSHLMLLEDAGTYRTTRPLEYFRTLKRVLEFLLGAGRISAARDLAPEVGRAYERAGPRLSALAHLSFIKNVAQVAAANGETYRALRLLYVCDQMSVAAGYAGQQRQVRSLMGALEGDSKLRLPTFALPR